MPDAEALRETLFSSPLGDVWVRWDEAGELAGIRLLPASPSRLVAGGAASPSQLAALAALGAALSACYEAPCDFDPAPWLEAPCVKRAGAFERAVWRQAAKLPCGEAESCEAVAARLGRPGEGGRVARAALACPLPVLIPVHRIGDAFSRAPLEQRALMRRLLEREQEKLVRWWF